ncbi:MAG: serine/threonine protein kinase [Kofleriaceae bacterium]|nr:serine/threonine protein kinase [Kofleriaceae bacterium]MBP6839627.1 serine/threonine protein kinase [Kofleriaceae bacterium]
MSTDGEGDEPVDAGRAPTLPSDPDGASAADPGRATRPSTGFRAVGPGDELGRYVLEDELGTGGMATVYRARDRDLRREVALKVLFPHLARRVDVVRRFQREGRAAAALDHAGILRVFDVGGGEGTPDPPYLVMELIRGQSLAEVVAARGPLLAELAALMAAQVADALAAAHAAGVIHRDVKPANVMVGPGGRLLLADFGVARVDDDASLVTRTGAVLGTPAFMAPEQAGGGEVDARSDVYSLGAALYQLATGVLPYSGNTARVIAQIAAGERMPAVRRRPAVGSELSRLIDRLMAVDPAQRPASAAAAAVELRALASEGGLTDGAAELAAFQADPAGYEASRVPAVAARLLAGARAAAAARRLPRALALVDRACVLAPDDAEAAALLAELARRPRGSRRGLAVGAAVLVALGGGAIAWRTRVGGDGGARTSTDSRASADATPTPADAAPVRTPTDAATAAVDAIPGADRVDARPGRADAGRGVDAGSPLVAARVDAAAPLVPVDAAAPPTPPADAAPAAPATLRVVMDAWCELSIDGAPAGRVDGTGREVEVRPGRHQLVCSQGKGLAEWRGEATARAGAVTTVRGALLAEVEVVVQLDAGDHVVVDGVAVKVGEQLRVLPGRHRVEVRSGEKRLSSSWVEIPRVRRCILKASPRLGCHPAP